MTNNGPRISLRRVITVIGLAVAPIMVLAATALAHPVFSNDEPGFPNPRGGTGGPGQTPPYPAGSRPTLNMFLPFEQDGVVFHGADNTTVDVRVTIPTAWTNPACGPARTSSQVGYRQMGTVVAGWTCAVETVSGHQVLHWSGPQVSSAQTHDDSAQFFTLQATMPSPDANTSYGAAGGPEGIHVKQVYADGATSMWTPPNDPSAGEIANGIVRTVARGTAPPPTPAPKPGGTTPGGAKPVNPPPTPAPQSGGGLATPSAAATPPTEPTAAVPPGTDPDNAPEITPTEASPGAESAPPSVEQLTQRNTAADQGGGWQVWAGIALGLVLLGAALIAVIKHRQRAP